MKLGFFSDVTVEREGSRDAPVLVYRVVERPAVREWRVDGERGALEEGPRGDRHDQGGTAPRPAAVQKDVKKIQEKYVEKGYYLAEVSSRVEERPDNQVDVVFVVNEQAKVQVKEVRFIGNAHISADDLHKVMQTREGEPALVPLRRGHLPRGGAPARPPGAPGPLPRPRLRHREGRDARRRALARPAPHLRHDPDRGGRAVHDREDRASRGSSSIRSRGSGRCSRRRAARPSPAPTSRPTCSRSATSTRTSATPTRTSSPLTATDPEKRIVDLTFDVQPGKVVTLRADRRRREREDPRQGDPARAADLRGRAVQRHRRCAPRGSA